MMRLGKTLLEELVRRLEKETPIIEIGARMGCIVPINDNLWEKHEIETGNIERKLDYNIKNAKYDTYLTLLADTILNNQPILIDEFDGLCCPVGEIYDRGRRYLLFIGGDGTYYLVSDRVLNLCSTYQRVSIPKNHVIRIDSSSRIFKDYYNPELELEFNLYYDYLPRLDEALSYLANIIYFANKFNICPITFLPRLNRIIREYEYELGEEFRKILTHLSKVPNLCELFLILGGDRIRLFRLNVDGYLPEHVLIYDFPLPRCGILIFSGGEEMFVLPCRSSDAVENEFSIFLLSNKLRDMFMFNRYLPTLDNVESFLYKISMKNRDHSNSIERIRNLLNNGYDLTIMMSVADREPTQRIIIKDVDNCDHYSYDVDIYNGEMFCRGRVCWIYGSNYRHVFTMLSRSPFTF